MFSEVAQRVELCLFDEAGRELASICRRSRTVLAWPFAGHRAGAPKPGSA
ncbi:MAG: hypothetical protein Q8K35_00460 [Thiobacillus sp.]|nr:hypothetical protein [Thiobacillus sp.]MDP2056217.1 hypothetical protein [Thiobacillus sp.]